MDDLILYLDALKEGRAVVVPTDTVYGLACVPEIEDAVRGIFTLKGRELDKPLPILGDSMEALRSVAVFDPRAEELARRFWPGPLTLVLKRALGFESDLGGGDVTSVAVRVPEHPLTRQLLDRSGPLAVTSANRSGEPPATTAAEANSAFPDLLVLDGGPGTGSPSTILSLLGPPKILRPGPISLKDFG
jgi:tRNA threonylcarbamoyl adenosine modification protein (Sua5/YciO/YrdC/YwlC family)